MNNRKRIAIIGGGPGGLTLARILSTRGISATVFELDAHALARPQGGSLDIHEESGQLALKLAGLEAPFKALARAEDQGVRLLDPQGHVHFEEVEPPAAESGRPEIDRTLLRTLLLESLPAGTVRWGTKVKAVEPLGDGTHRVVGEEGSLGEFDLVVGADGAWSKVRPLVSGEKPRYTGVTFIELVIPDADARHPALAAQVGHGKIFALGESKGIIAQRNGQGLIRVYLAFRVPEDWLSSGAVDLASPERARASLRQQFAGWAPSLLAFIDAASEVIIPRALVALPIGHRWTHRPGVTLLGDAAHVMSPFTGEGVNIAMLDAAKLALALTEDGDWNRAVATYEQDLFARAEREATGAAASLDSTMGENGLANMVAFFRSMQAAPDAPSVAHAP